MFDQDEDVPGYLTDAYKTAIEKGLLSLTLTRIGTENRMWQASSRFPRSSGYHVHIEADALQAVMGALGAWTRLDPELRAATAIPAPLEAPMPAPEPAGFFDEPADLQQERREDRDEASSLFD